MTSCFICYLLCVWSTHPIFHSNIYQNSSSRCRRTECKWDSKSIFLFLYLTCPFFHALNYKLIQNVMPPPQTLVRVLLLSYNQSVFKAPAAAHCILPISLSGNTESLIYSPMALMHPSQEHPQSSTARKQNISLKENQLKMH